MEEFDTSINILIVEDEVIIAMDLKNILSTIGYNVVNIVSSCKETLNTLRNTNTDLILLDIHIKGELNGIDTAMLIKKKFEIPIIYITASLGLKSIEQIKLTEPYGYLIKPIDPIQLQTNIELALHKHQMKKKRLEKM